MVYFNASNPSAGTEYQDVIIVDPLLTDYEFTKFKRLLNGNAIKMILHIIYTIQDLGLFKGIMTKVARYQ
jgi:hypothetical protein